VSPGRRIRSAAGLVAALPLLACAQDSVTGTLGGAGADVFRVGAQVVLQQPAEGDAFLAGGTVESNASIGRDATAAAGRVAIRATVGGDLTAAGGQIEVDALVAGRARLAGGSVTVLPESRIDGSVAVAGGSVRLAGRFKRDLRVAGGDVTLGGDIGGNVRVYAGQLTVLPGTRIGGTLVYRAANAVQLPPDVQIGGAWGPRPDPRAERGWRAAPGGWLATALFVLAVLLLLALLLLLVRVSKSTTAALAGRPWFGLWVGFAALVAVPSLAVFLALTLVGLPLAIALFLLYLAALAIAYVIGVIYLGDRALAGATPGREATTALRVLAFALALAVLAVIGVLPLIGGLAQFAVLLLGLGGMVLALWPGRAGGRSA